MAHGLVSDFRPAFGFAAHPQEARSALIRFDRIHTLWAARSHQRKALGALEGHLLRNIGVTREDARREAIKPF